jgi:hypothetical protein
MKTLASLLKALPRTKVIDSTIDYSEYIPLDLSVINKELGEKKTKNASDFEVYIQNYLEINNVKVAYGGYIETRNMYKRSSIFKKDSQPERHTYRS